MVYCDLALKSTPVFEYSGIHVPTRENQKQVLGLLAKFEDMDSKCVDEVLEYIKKVRYLPANLHGKSFYVTKDQVPSLDFVELRYHRIPCPSKDSKSSEYISFDFYKGFIRMNEKMEKMSEVLSLSRVMSGFYSTWCIEPQGDDGGMDRYAFNLDDFFPDVELERQFTTQLEEGYPQISDGGDETFLLLPNCTASLQSGIKIRIMPTIVSGKKIYMEEDLNFWDSREKVLRLKGTHGATLSVSGTFNPHVVQVLDQDEAKKFIKNLFGNK